MIDFEKLNKENTLVAPVMQSCVGAISPNMRMISFSYKEKQIDIFFDLSEASSEDNEEATDIADDLSIYTENFRVIEHVRVVGHGRLPLPSDETIVIYKQREQEPIS
ncbi:hypothetical protein [uncultured Litoreibacter sp.]|uniref:hypothetical protein n=1 Tax=uncultured Litoreibacter sp. TaxID=1392394 RepID=UPI0026163D51|nr:hypothetical protein [uncultured Litoreibacter sp.]